MPAFRTQRNAFTLVELLVVIGIIAVLVGILLPVLGRARETAKWVQCQSNLRQISTAVRIYSNDNKDRYPDQYTVGGAPFRRAPGQVVPGDPSSLQERYGLAAVLHGITESDLSSDLFTTTAYATKSTLKTKFKYLQGDSKVWICPGATEYIQDFGNTYLANLLPTSTATSMGNWTSKQRGKSDSSEVFYVYDNFTNLPWTTAQRRTTGTLPLIITAQRQYPHPFRTRVRRAANVLYIDGSVGTATYDPVTGKITNVRG